MRRVDAARETTRPPAMQRSRAARAHVTRALAQLASLLHAGLPLIVALEVLQASTSSPALRALFEAIRHDVTQGMSLSHAFARHPHCLSERCRALVSVGEASGSLEAMLQRVAAERLRAAAQRAKLARALTYPACLLIFCFAVVVVLTHWVIPVFEDIFRSFDAALPTATRVVVDVSHRIARAVPYTVCGLCACGGVHFVAMRRSARLRNACARHLLALPMIGPLVARAFAAQWCRALGTLLGAGIPLGDALDILANTSAHPVFNQISSDTGMRIRRGERFGDALAHHAAMPSSVVEPIAVADHSGALDTLLIDLATLADQELESRIDMLLNLLEPTLVALLGLLIGGVVITLYLPIIELGHVV